MVPKTERRYDRADLSKVSIDELQYRRFLLANHVDPEFIDHMVKLVYGDGSTVVPPPERRGVIRKPRDPNKLHPLYTYTPFGIEDNKIIIPKHFEQFLEVYGIETVYNVVMVVNNITSWILLSPDQKEAVLQFCRDNPNRVIFGAANKAMTYADLLEYIHKYVMPYAKDISPITYASYSWRLEDLCSNSAISIQVRYYVPLLYELNKDSIIFKDVRSENFYVAGKPQIKMLPTKEHPIN